jgi:hypothetical protein
MGSFRPRALAAALALAGLLALPGCEYAVVSLKLPTFFSAGIEQVWFWRLDEHGGGYVRTGHIRVEGLAFVAGRQQLRYVIVSPNGAESHELVAPVAVEGDAVTAALNFARWSGPGWFRVSARNDAGESPLSAREIYF